MHGAITSSTAPLKAMVNTHQSVHLISLASEFSSLFRLAKVLVCDAEIAICYALPCSVPNLQSDGKVLSKKLNSSFKLAKSAVYVAEVAICSPLPCSVPNLQSDGEVLAVSPLYRIHTLCPNKLFTHLKKSTS